MQACVHGCMHGHTLTTGDGQGGLHLEDNRELREGQLDLLLGDVRGELQGEDIRGARRAQGQEAMISLEKL